MSVFTYVFLIEMLINYREYKRWKSGHMPAELIPFFVDPEKYRAIAKVSMESSAAVATVTFFKHIIPTIAIGFSLIPKAWEWFEAKTSSSILTSSSAFRVRASVMFIIILGSIYGILILIGAFLAQLLMPNAVDYKKLALGLLWAIRQVIIGNTVYALLYGFLATRYNKNPKKFWRGLLLLVLSLVVLVAFGPAVLIKLIPTLPLSDSLSKKAEALFSRVGFDGIECIRVLDPPVGEPNAAFLGFGPLKSIILFKSLIVMLPENNLMAVLAHELGHWYNNDIPIRIFEFILLAAALCFLTWWIRGKKHLFKSLGFTSDSAPPFVICLFCLGILSNVLIFIFQPLNNMLGWYMEYRADTYATKLGYGKDIIEALLILADSGGKWEAILGDWMFAIFHFDHPTLAMRIRNVVANQ